MGSAWSTPEIFDPNKLWTPQQLLPYFISGVYIIFIVWKSFSTFIIFAVSLPNFLYYFMHFKPFIYFSAIKMTVFPNAWTCGLESLRVIITRRSLSSTSSALSPTSSDQVSFIYLFSFNFGLRPSKVLSL